MLAKRFGEQDASRTAALHGRPALRSALAAGVLAVAVGAAAYSGVRAGDEGRSSPLPPAPVQHRFSQAQRLGPTSAALGAHDPAYRATADDTVLRAENPAQHMTSSFTRAGVSVSAHGVGLTMRVDGVGYGDSLTALAAVAPRASGNRVLYARPGVSEWYENGPLGLEQGFTLTRPPAGRASGPLTLSIGLSGSSRFTLGGGGRSLAVQDGGGRALTYSGLSASDASGKPLASWLELRGSHLWLRVRAAGARFPLHIDPFVSVHKLACPYCSMVLSGDGSTVLIGLPQAESGTGSVTVYVHTAEGWQQQATLTGAGEVGAAHFGGWVRLSADGNTALVAGLYNNGARGAVWIFTRSAGTWTQQAELTGEGVENEHFGAGASLAGDGETALINGAADKRAYVFQREGETWTEQVALEPEQGSGDVAISGDGDTAVIANSSYKAPKQRKASGLVWVYTRSAGMWVQQAELTSGETGSTDFGESVALSEDGSTVLAGGPYGKGLAGKVWAFGRVGETWVKQATIPSPRKKAKFGISLALSANGDTGLIGTEAVIFPPDERERAREKITPQYAYVYVREGETWTQHEAINGHIRKEAERFGTSVRLSAEGTTALVEGEQNFEPVIWFLEEKP